MDLAKSLNDIHGVAIIVSAAAVTVIILVAAFNVEAKVTALFSAGSTCNGAPSASFKASGPAVKVSLCVASSNEFLCGHTTKLQAANARSSGRFHITGVILAPPFSDPNANLIFPIPITDPAAMIDLGATVSHAVAATDGKTLIATFDLSPQANANEAVYVLSLAPSASVGVGTDARCTLPFDAPIAASFKLIRGSSKALKSK